MENTYKASLITEITAAIEAQVGYPIATPNTLSGLCAGIANAEIPFLVANMEVNPGTMAVTPSAMSNGGGPLTGSGLVDVGFGTVS